MQCAVAQPEADVLVESLPYRVDGGADRDRTDDILLAKQALSQLSYSPILRYVVDQNNTSSKQSGGPG